jgi:hypothetical protein
MKGNPELRSIPELVTDSLWNHEQESAFGAVCLLCHFDRDWEHFALVQVWDRFADKPEWVYSLWYWGEDDLAEHLCDFSNKWEEGDIPWVAAATLVGDLSRQR